jgi:hypothetical protein
VLLLLLIAAASQLSTACIPAACKLLERLAAQLLLGLLLLLPPAQAAPVTLNRYQPSSGICTSKGCVELLLPPFALPPPALDILLLLSLLLSVLLLLLLLPTAHMLRPVSCKQGLRSSLHSASITGCASWQSMRSTRSCFICARMHAKRATASASYLLLLLLLQCAADCLAGLASLLLLLRALGLVTLLLLMPSSPVNGLGRSKLHSCTSTARAPI